MASANQANQAAVPRRLNNRRVIAKGLKHRFRSSRPNGRSWSTRRSARRPSPTCGWQNRLAIVSRSRPGRSVGTPIAQADERSDDLKPSDVLMGED